MAKIKKILKNKTTEQIKQNDVYEDFLRVGFWYSEDEPHFPKPEIDDERVKNNKDKIISYLKNGKVILSYFGWSYCRFKCGIPDYKMGDKDLTDGKWVWPEGLIHYVEKHNVKLPDDFINHIMNNTKNY